MTVTVGANAEPRAPKRKRTAQISRVRLAPECVGHPAVHQGAYRRAEEKRADDDSLGETGQMEGRSRSDARS